MKFTFRYGLVLAFGIFAFDQIVKFFAAQMPLGVKHEVFPGLWWTFVQNTGISFGFFQGNNLLMIWLTITIFGLLVYWYDTFTTTLSRVAYFFIMAGLFGNLVDRILRGFVVDMIDLGWFPVFNIADSAISIAVILLLVDELKTFFAQKSSRSSS